MPDTPLFAQWTPEISNELVLLDEMIMSALGFMICKQQMKVLLAVEGEAEAYDQNFVRTESRRNN